MLKKDKRYQDLAIKVATKMCKAHIDRHMQTSAPESLLTLAAIHMTIFPDTDATELRRVLLTTFNEAMRDYNELLSNDTDFMDVLVGELGLSLSDIDFEDAVNEFKQEISDLVDEIVISSMEAEREFADD
ncbi:MAG: hypothetical protein GOVbin1753_21 [Prokaryotic dsDNA virus sp.]|nr:MAG: hypothetical protein GOVbin1753_21 [Prokaryotic dsDNA virus sp.]|tara:strand:- start:280 stop:669 length:390 start_codon:yes stop_codon:yes gene_type:complete